MAKQVQASTLLQEQVTPTRDASTRSLHRRINRIHLQVIQDLVVIHHLQTTRELVVAVERLLLHVNELQVQRRIQTATCLTTTTAGAGVPRC